MKLKTVVVSLGMLGMMSVPAFAVTQQDVNKLAKQVNVLQQQVNALQNEVQAQHRQNHSVTTKKSISPVSIPHPVVPVTPDQPEHTPSGSSSLPSSGVTYLPVDLDVPGQSFVSSGPYIGIPLQFSGSNLIINSPSVNQDVALLKIRKNILLRLRALGVMEEQDHAHVLLSGAVEGQAMYKNIGGGSDSTDIDLTNATLDAYILGPSDWVSALMSLTYDNDLGTNSGSLANNSRDLNSRVYIAQAFITIGDLLKSPVYGTFGQLYVPFGTYSSNMVSSPLTKIMARTKARTIVLGYQPQNNDGLYGAGYIFRGDTRFSSVNRVNNGGMNLGYRFHLFEDVVHSDIGTGVIANMADSVGMQAVANNAFPTFNGFGGINGTGNEQLQHRVPAYDFRGLWSMGKVDLLAEYIISSNHFSPLDMTMNSHGARPQALNAEAAYTFDAFARPTSVAVGYGMTKDALALQLPAQRYSAVLNTSIWKDTLQSIEFRHDVNYAASHVATGSGQPAPSASGKSDNAITAQFDVYF